ncbi:hypothetical protein HPB51_018344 [Rhipicephalus microplus]|uniref:Uncharacterized protein n=1 Tax=Rhipicephalus microplus TaxID=6941 RepID=A0A9J6EUS8_RHIMP|nr:hypothetical protein HPB51_018344 [Rhipicephalus microplus]
MQDFETRFATRLLSLVATLPQRATTVDIVADLAAGLSVIEEQPSLQQRVSTAVERYVLSAPLRFFGAQLPPPTFDGSTSRAAFLVQFESVVALNDWEVQNEAQALVVQLCGAAVEYLEYSPQVVHSNYKALVSALESRFGDSLLQLYLTQLKHVRQGRGDLQELAAHVDSLSLKALSGCPTATMDLIAANAFVDAISNKRVQHLAVNELQLSLLRRRYKNARKQLGIYTGGRPTRTHHPGPGIWPLLGYMILQCYPCDDVVSDQVTDKLSSSYAVFLGKLQCGPLREGSRMMAEGPLLSLGPFTDMRALPLKLGDPPPHVEAIVDTGAAFSF